MPLHTVSDRQIQENPILRAARANSTPVSVAPSHAPVSPSTTPSPERKPTSTRTKTVTSSTGTIPNVENITPNTVIQDITRIGEETMILRTQKANALEAQGDLNSEIADIVKDTAEHQAVINLEKNIAERDAQLTTNYIINQRGGGGDGAAAGELARIAAKKFELAGEVERTQQAVADEVANTSPIARFFGLDNIDDVVEEANIAAASYRKLDNIQDNMLSGMDATRQAIHNMKVTTTTAAVQADQSLVAGIAAEASAKADIAAEQNHAAATQIAIDQTHEQQLNQRVKLDILQQQKRIELTEQQMEFAAKSARENDASKVALREGAIKGAEKVGLVVYKGTDPALIAKQNAEYDARLSGKAGPAELKESLTLFSKGVGIVKPSPYENYRSKGVYNSAELAQPTTTQSRFQRNVMGKVYTDAAVVDPITGKPTRIVDNTNITGLYNDEYNKQISAMRTEIVENDASNIYQALPLETIIAMPAVADTALVIKVLGELFKNESTKDYTPSQLVDIGMEAVALGTITEQELASGIVAIYTKSGSVKTANEGWFDLGIPIQTSYNTKITALDNLATRIFAGEGTPGVNAVVDLTDETAVMNMILRLKSFSLFEEAGTAITGAFSSTPAKFALSPVAATIGMFVDAVEDRDVTPVTPVTPVGDKK